MTGVAKPGFKQRCELVVAGCLDSFARDLGWLVLRPGVSEVHELRISIRRLQQVLELCSDTRNRKARRSLRRLMKLCGVLRDCDVAKAYFQGEDFRRVRADLGAQRLSAEEDLAHFLRCHATELRVHGGAGLRFSFRRVRTAIQKLASEFLELGNQAIARGFRMKDLHEARVATKRLRYTVELFCSQPDSLEPLLELQRLLGRVHDLGVFRKRMKRWDEAGGAKDRIALEQERLIVEFSEIWRQTILPGHARLVGQWLAAIDPSSMAAPKVD